MTADKMTSGQMLIRKCSRGRMPAYKMTINKFSLDKIIEDTMTFYVKIRQDVFIQNNCG
jgi:hypothetical protein